MNIWATEPHATKVFPDMCGEGAENLEDLVGAWELGFRDSGGHSCHYANWRFLVRVHLQGCSRVVATRRL